MRSVRLLLSMLVSTLLVAGCAIQPDASPRNIPDEEQGSFGADEATGGEAAGSSLIFLLAPQSAAAPQLLRSVMRDVPPQTPAVLRALFDGPNTTELGDDLDSAIPTELVLNSARLVGRTTVVDINDGLDQLDAVDLRNAVAQIVMTATAIDGVDSVRIRVNGEDRVWPRGDGELTKDALSPYDFPGTVESTQPSYPSLSSASR